MFRTILLMKLNVRNMMKKLLVTLAVVSTLSACATQNPNTVVIDGKEFQKDPNGVIHLSKSELNAITSEGGSTFVEGDVPDIKLTQTEYELVKTNQDAFFSLVGQANPDESVSMLVKPGSLKANLERLVSENNWNALYYEGPDLFISTPSILEAGNVPMATMSLIETDIAYPCINEVEKVITVIKAE
jgi:hypothetical protein